MTADTWMQPLEGRVMLSTAVIEANGDAVVSVVASDDTADESGDTGAFTLTRTGDTDAPLTVQFSLTGEAINGTDYSTITQSATFDVGETQAIVAVEPISDDLVEGSERVILQVQSGEGYVADPQSASDIVTIADDDTLGPIQVNITATTTPVTEGGSNGVFTLTRSGDTSQSLTVNYSVTGEATSGDDYTSIGQSVTFDAGEDTATIDVQTIDDADLEGDERVIVQLEASNDYIVGDNGSATVTIEDDDAVATPTVNVVASDASADESGGTGVFTFTRDGSLDDALTVNYTITGTATNGADYQTLTGTVEIPANEASVTVDVTPINDADFEGNETVIVELALNGAAYNIGNDDSATVTIADDETLDAPTVNVVASDDAADESGGTGVFTFTRDGSLDEALTVNYTITGTATNGTDYQTLTGTVEIPANQASATVDVTPIDDDDLEGPETVIVELTLNGAAYNIGDNDSAIVNLADDETLDTPTVNVVASDNTADESGGTGVFTFTRDGALDALTVNYTITGTATNGTDYQTLTGTVEIAANETSVTVDVTPIDDAIFEGNETVIVELTLNGDTYNIGDDSSAIVTIADDEALDAPTVNVVASDAAADESGGTGVFTFTREGALDEALTVNYTITGTATNGTDYQTLTGTIEIPADQASATVDVTPIDDAIFEGNETVIVELALNGAAYTIGNDDSATVTIADDEVVETPTVNVVASDDSADESGNTGVFTFTRNGALDEALTVNYTITGTATNGTDYQTLTGTIEIPADQASATVDVTPIDDAIFEGNETVIVELALNGAAYTIGNDDSATVTIADDEQGPVVEVNVVANDPDALESGDAGTFTVTRTGSTDGDLVVNLTLNGTATNGVDFQNIPATVTILSGASTATITVAPIDDGDVEGNETVVLSLDNSVNYTLGDDDSATVTIADDDQEQVVTLTVTDPQANESGGSGAFTITRTGSSQDDLVVQLSIAGTAANGVDYDNIPATVTIPGGSTSVTVNIDPINDAAFEGDETVMLSIQAGAGYSLGDNTEGTVVILDNETGLPTVTLLATDANASEDGNTGTFTVFRTGSTDGDLVVNYTVSGSATGGTDYNAIENSVTIPAGSSSANVTITPVDDDDAENSETVTLTLTDTDQYDLGDDTEGTVTITDDPALTEVSIAANDALAFEPGGTGTFTITRVGSTENDLTVNLQITGTANNGTDYDAIPTTVTILAGSSTATITVNPLDDSEVEGDETVTLTLIDDEAYNLAGQTSDTVTIEDGDVPTVVTIAASDDLATEGDGNAAFTITRTGSTAEELTVEFTVTGTATNGADYTQIPTTVTIPAGESTVDVTVVPTDDVEVEGDETVILTLNPNAAYEVGDDDTATATITDNDAEPVVTIMTTDSNASEGGDTGTFVITRTGPTDQPLTVQFNVTGTATNGADYQNVTSTVTIAAGESTAEVTVTPVDDSNFEGDETVILTLVDAEGYSVGGQDSATVTIQDNDADVPTISVSATDGVAGEDGDTGVFTITRSDTSGDLEVSYTLSGTATNGTDYQALSGTVTIPDGQNSVQITLTPTQDGSIEGQELATLTLVDAATYEIDNGSDTIVITDDDGNLVTDLALTLDDTPLPDTLVPGQKIKRTYIVSNIGGEDVRSRTTLNLYLLPVGQDLPGPGDQPVFSKETNFNVKEDRTKKVNANFTVPDNIDPGTVRLVAVLDGDNAVPEVNVLNNVVRSDPTEIAFAFGDVDGETVKKLTVNGVTYQLKGAGTGTVIPGVGEAPDSIQLTGTDADSRLQIKGTRNANSLVQNIDVQGDLREIKGSNVRLAGNITSTGTIDRVRNLDFVDDQQSINIQGNTAGRTFELRGREVNNVSINSNIPVGRLSVVQWTDDDATPDVINAPSIDRLQSKGDFSADLNLTDPVTSLNRAQVRGALANSNIRTVGGINDLQAGVFDNANVYSGVVNGFNGLPTGANDFQSIARIENVRATGIRNDNRASFTNSRLAADQFGSITLRDVNTDNAGQEFGIAANTSVDRFNLSGQAPQSGLSNTGTFSGDGDFNARIV